MAKVIKEKNILKFYLTDEDKHYDFDINTGVLYGLKGSPLKRSPSGFASFMYNVANQSNVLYFMYRSHTYYSRSYSDLKSYAELLKICDKIDGIGYKMPAYWLRSKELTFINDNFKSFSKCVKENPNCSLDDFINNTRMAIWLKKYQLKLDDYFTTDMAKGLMEYREDWDLKKLHCAVFYLKKGLHNVYIGYNPYGHALSTLDKYFYYCDNLGIEYTKGDFVREFTTAKKNYEFRKEEIDNNKIFENQMKHIKALKFSNDDFEIIVPMTSKEFITESENQNNCVARTYLPKVVNGETNIVFVRKKNDLEKSYITCEVYNGRIIQYLAKNNSYVSDENANHFETLYQSHLQLNWGE